MTVHIFSDYLGSEGRGKSVATPLPFSLSLAVWAGLRLFNGSKRIAPGKLIPDFPKGLGRQFPPQKNAQCIFGKRISVHFGPAVFIKVLLAGVKVRPPLLFKQEFPAKSQGRLVFIGDSLSLQVS